jgi:hypothetical protein
MHLCNQLYTLISWTAQELHGQPTWSARRIGRVPTGPTISIAWKVRSLLSPGASSIRIHMLYYKMFMLPRCSTVKHKGYSTVMWHRTTLLSSLNSKAQQHISHHLVAESPLQSPSYSTIHQINHQPTITLGHLHCEPQHSTYPPPTH